MRIERWLTVLLVGVLALPATLRAQCLDCDGSVATLAGSISTTKFRHEGTGQVIDCITLKLDAPVCMACDFVGREQVSEVQLADPSGTVKLPTSGRVQVQGQLVPGETAWYCRNVGVLVTKVGLPSLAVAIAGRPSKDAYPVTVGGGPLGYGAPDKVVSDVASWTHAIKSVLAAFGYRVTRVEFYKSGAYPAFYVAESDANTPLRTLQLHQTSVADNQAKAILKANGGWAFEVVTATGDRLRYNALRSAANAGFDLVD